jgi:hypothetical protein
MSKRNPALEVLGGIGMPAPMPTTPETSVVQLAPARPSREVGKVMLYLPPAVARKFKEMAFHEECKAHDLYVRALAEFLRSAGHTQEAYLLKK